MKRIIDDYGRNVTINENGQKLHNYNNQKRIARYDARIMHGNQVTQFVTTYTQCNAFISDIEERLETFANPVKAQYADIVYGCRSKYDKHRKIWKKIVNYVKNNESLFFDSYGDFLYNIPNLVKNIGIDVPEYIEGYGKEPLDFEKD